MTSEPFRSGSTIRYASRSERTDLSRCCLLAPVGRRPVSSCIADVAIDYEVIRSLVLRKASFCDPQAERLTTEQTSELHFSLGGHGHNAAIVQTDAGVNRIQSARSIVSSGISECTPFAIAVSVADPRGVPDKKMKPIQALKKLV